MLNATLDALPPDLITIDGQTVHSPHVASPVPDAVSLLARRGCPSSVMDVG